MRRIATASLAGLFSLLPGHAESALLTLDFGSADVDLPYSQNGFLFTVISGSGGIRGSPNDMLITGGSFGPEVRMRGSSGTPFDLLSLQIVRTNQDWHLETSAGGVFSIPSTGVLDFAGVGGFSNLTWFDLVNPGGVPNALLYVDDITVRVLSEPPPTLRIDPASPGLLLRWPGSATNFVLEATSALSPASDWQTVTNATKTADGMLSVTVDGQLPRQFFRLRAVSE